MVRQQRAVELKGKESCGQTGPIFLLVNYVAQRWLNVFLRLHISSEAFVVDDQISRFRAQVFRFRVVGIFCFRKMTQKNFTIENFQVSSELLPFFIGLFFSGQ